MANNSDELPREAGAGPIFHPDWGTHAYASYQANTTGLAALLAMVLPEESDDLEARQYLLHRRSDVDNRYSGPWAIDTERTMLSWQIAMRVSAVEVYLQDALTFLALYDRDFMRSRGSVQHWDYDAIRHASDTDNALWTYCNRWARGFVADGGPKRWAGALHRSGLGRFDDIDLDQLEAMWGYRHLRIHNAGRLTPDFARRHSSEADLLWKEGLSHSRAMQWTTGADEFVDRIEAGVAGRLRARLGQELIAEREQLEMDRQFGFFDAQFKRGLLTRYPNERVRIEAAWAEDDSRRAISAELLARIADEEELLADGDDPRRRASDPSRL